MTLIRSGADVGRTGKAIASTAGTRDWPFDGPLRFTPRAKKVLALAMIAAAHSQSTSVRPEHILQAIIDEGCGIAAGILKRLGIAPSLT